MTLETQNSGVLEGVTEADLSRVFDDDDFRGGFLILKSDDGSFLQAAGKGWSPYTLEFFQGKDNRGVSTRTRTTVRSDSVRPENCPSQQVQVRQHHRGAGVGGWTA